jgi:hypothetical protein
MFVICRRVTNFINLAIIYSNASFAALPVDAEKRFGCVQFVSSV